jgi:hypothetical protein
MRIPARRRQGFESPILHSTGLHHLAPGRKPLQNRGFSYARPIRVATLCEAKRPVADPLFDPLLAHPAPSPRSGIRRRRWWMSRSLCALVSSPARRRGHARQLSGGPPTLNRNSSLCHTRTRTEVRARTPMTFRKSGSALRPCLSTIARCTPTQVATPSPSLQHSGLQSEIPPLHVYETN